MAGKKSVRDARSSGQVAELPDGPPDASGLTPRQQRVLTVIKDSIERRGYPPSMREIGERVGLTSSSSVAHQLRVLEEKGYLKRDPNRPRAIEIVPSTCFRPVTLVRSSGIGGNDSFSRASAIWN